MLATTGPKTVVEGGLATQGLEIMVVGVLGDMGRISKLCGCVQKLITMSIDHLLCHKCARSNALDHLCTF